MHKTILLASILLAAAGPAIAGSHAGDVDALKRLEAERWTVPESGMEMRRIPAGTFTMGSPEDEPHRRSDETQHGVTISRPFYMGVQVVRQGDYYEVMMPGNVLMPDDFDFDTWLYRRGPLHYGAAWAWRWPPQGIIHGGGAHTHEPVSLSYPMTPVSWYDAMRFCRLLTDIERQAGRLPEGYVYRLPTEAEWEYAARAGTTGPYSFDHDLTEDDEDRFAQYVATTKEGGHTFGPVDTQSDREPNPWGLQDMHGNVYEWCLDWYGLYKESAQTDPIGLSMGKERAERVARGGALPDWDAARSRHEFYRSASRYSFPAHAEYQINLGFRVVLAPEGPLRDRAIDRNEGLRHGEPSARSHDFFRNIRYPGQRRPEVGLDRIEQEGGPDAVGAYHQRVVHWWPKQGVDIVEVPEGAPLRTWTIRTGEVEPLVAAGTYAKWWPQTLRGQTAFKAHLLGFRGIGSETGHPYFPMAEERARGPGIAPAVVLRMEDGRKRTFTRGAFVDEDQAYLMDLYRQEMNRMSATLEPAPTKVRERTELDYPNAAEPYEPGTIQLHTDHIVFLAGSEQPKGWGEFFNSDYQEKATVFRNTFTRLAQDFWVYNEYAGRLMPYWEQDEQYKYEILVGLTRVNGATDLGGGSGGGYGRCGVAGWVAFYHEWGHGQARNGMVLMGGGETHCDAHQILADPTIVWKVSHQIERPWKNLFHGQYPGALAYTMMGDDPNWGYAAPGTFTSLMTMEEHTPMHAIARLGEERGIWENGIQGMGDFMGQIGARFAEYDTELETGLREVFPSPNRAMLVALDRAKGLYRSTATEAPEPFGVNLIRLEAEPGAEKISVDFQGHFDAATHSDWRACIVAVDKDGRSRYSPLWNKGVMAMETRPGDQRYWLTVTATPYALTSPQPNGRMTVQHVYQGAFTYRYPYDVTLTGCRPATPNASFAFNENWELNRDPIWPVPSDSPEYPVARRHLTEIQGRVPAVLAAIEEEGLFGDVLGYHINQRNRAIGGANAVKRRAEWLLENAQGVRHPNGGGWVAATAEVAPTAYVGPDCMVLDGAKVLDHAAIEDYAIVSGGGVVIRDHAKIRGKAVVTGNVTVSGYARVSRNLSGDSGERTGVEQRRLFELLNPILYANYAFDRPETVLLEDTFVEHSYEAFASGSHLETLIFFDGRLYGDPGFLVDGDVRAITFNGEEQYAEADPAVADLGEITIDMAFRWDGGAATLLDFGSSADDRFMLTIAGNGEVALALISSGERETLTAGEAIASGDWTRCRIEIDGSTASLWINGERSASIATEYRAADAFKPGREMRNFVAASRESGDLFAGAMEYLRIYHAVVDDFSQVGDPLMISSRRISEDFVERFQAQFADYEEQEKEFHATLREHPVYKYYRDYYQRVVDRIAEMEASEEVEELEAQLRAMEAGPERSLLQGEIRNLRRRNGLEVNADEYKALVGFTGWQERQYTRPPPVERLKQRTLPFMPECRTQLYEAFPIQKSDWHTTVEWDGQLEWEKADEPLSPIMARWIQRMKPYASQP